MSTCGFDRGKQQLGHEQEALDAAATSKLNTGTMNMTQ